MFQEFQLAMCLPTQLVYNLSAANMPKVHHFSALSMYLVFTAAVSDCELRSVFVLYSPSEKLLSDSALEACRHQPM